MRLPPIKRDMNHFHKSNIVRLLCVKRKKSLLKTIAAKQDSNLGKNIEWHVVDLWATKLKSDGNQKMWKQELRNQKKQLKQDCTHFFGAKDKHSQKLLKKKL